MKKKDDVRQKHINNLDRLHEEEGTLSIETGGNGKPWHLYVLRCSDGTLYTGVTTSLDRRVHEHNTSKRGAKYTKTRRPVELAWSKKYNNRSEAQSAEYSFKKLRRVQKLQIIKGEANV
jgi:putative endonuclease